MTASGDSGCSKPRLMTLFSRMTSAEGVYLNSIPIYDTHEHLAPCEAAREKETPIFAEKAVKVKREEPQKEKAPIKKMSYKDQREYDTSGDEIAALEEKIAKTDADMAACATDFTHLQELSAEKEALEAKLEERMERWMELSELAEEIERNKA